MLAAVRRFRRPLVLLLAAAALWWTTVTLWDAAASSRTLSTTLRATVSHSTVSHSANGEFTARVTWPRSLPAGGSGVLRLETPPALGDPIYEVVLVGPLRMQVPVFTSGSNASLQSISISAPPIAGRYSIYVRVLHLSAADAYSSLPAQVSRRALNALLCASSSSSEKCALPQLFVVPAGTPRKPDALPHEGFWGRNHANCSRDLGSGLGAAEMCQSTWAWQPVATSKPLGALDRDSLKTCLAQTHVVFVGDSHVRLLFEALATALGGTTDQNRLERRWFNETRLTIGTTTLDYFALRGIYFTAWPRPVEFYTQPNATLPRSRDDLDAVAQERLPAVLKQSLNASAVHVIAGSGAWDLRDWSVEQYCSDLREFVAQIIAGAQGQSRPVHVWLRTLVPPPDLGLAGDTPEARLHASKDHRTLAKFARADAECWGPLRRSFSVNLSANVRVGLLDSWNLLRHVREAACDGNHYMCNVTTSHARGSGTLFRASKPVAAGYFDFYAVLHTLCRNAS